MKDNLLIITRLKKTVTYLDKLLENFNRNENVLRDNIKKTMYQLLEDSYSANIYNKEEKINYQKQMLVHIKMLDFYIQLSYNKKMISSKQYTMIGNHLLDIYVLVQAWIKSVNNETS